MLVTLELNLNITFIWIYVMLFESVVVNASFASVSVWECRNVIRSVFCHPHVSFLIKPLYTIINFVFSAYITLKVSLGIFLIGDTPMLQTFLYHYQIYFLLLELYLILQLLPLAFHQNLHSPLKPHLLRTLNMCFYQ